MMPLKGIVHPKMKIVNISYVVPHVIPAMHFFISVVKHMYSGAINFSTDNRTRMIWLPAFLKIAYFVFQVLGVLSL